MVAKAKWYHILLAMSQGGKRQSNPNWESQSEPSKALGSRTGDGGEEVESAGPNHKATSSAEAKNNIASPRCSRALGKSSPPLCPTCPGKPLVLSQICDLTTHLVLFQILPLHLVPQTLPHANPASSRQQQELLPQGISSWCGPLIQLPW